MSVVDVQVDSRNNYSTVLLSSFTSVSFCYWLFPGHFQRSGYGDETVFIEHRRFQLNNLIIRLEDRLRRKAMTRLRSYKGNDRWIDFIIVLFWLKKKKENIAQQFVMVESRQVFIKKVFWFILLLFLYRLGHRDYLAEADFTLTITRWIYLKFHLDFLVKYLNHKRFTSPAQNSFVLTPPPHKKTTRWLKHIK